MIEHIGSAPVPFASTENIADDPFTRAAVASLVETTLHNIALTGAIGFGEIALGGELISQIAFHNADALTALNRIENHDPYTVIHSLNVCALALCIAYVDGIDESAAENLATAALLHDIGKTRVPLHILNKPGPLTLRELGVVRRHAADGEAILSALPGVSEEALRIAAQHHERLDGSGYPNGPPGRAIPSPGPAFGRGRRLRRTHLGAGLPSGPTSRRRPDPNPPPARRQILCRNGRPLRRLPQRSSRRPGNRRLT